MHNAGVPRRRVARSSLRKSEWLRWLLSLGSFILLWWGIVWIFRIPDYILPSPLQTASALIGDARLLAQHAIYTLVESVVGLVAALALGVSVALVMHAVPWVRYLAYPHLVLMQAIPLIAVAPILIVWFGFGALPKVLVVMFVCFFPVAVNAFEGFRSVDPTLREVLDAFGANRWALYKHLYIPATVPAILAGAKIAATYAVLGAVIGEWLGGSNGIGVYMTRAQRSFRVDRLFASVLLVMLLSFLLFKLVEGLGSLSTPWLRRRSSS